jgi:ACT domain-containing protein
MEEKLKETLRRLPRDIGTLAVLVATSEGQLKEVLSAWSRGAEWVLTVAQDWGVETKETKRLRVLLKQMGEMGKSLSGASTA